jgi:hypothetical protein
LIPVVEARWRDSPFDWAPSDAGKDWIELGAECSDDDVALVVAILASYNQAASSGSIPEVAQALEAAQTMVLPGGLMVRSNDFEIAPSCCCGLETWREWYGVKPGGSSPWLGHGPSPWVDCKSDAAVMWADGDLGDRSPSMSVSYAEIEAARNAASEALKSFEARLSDWLATHASQSQGLALRFANAFDLA